MVDYPRLLGALNRHEVRYVVVGGVAATAHGSPSFTVDLDICYDRTQPNARALARALEELRAVLHDGGQVLQRSIDHRTLARGDFFTFFTEAGALDCLGAPDGTTGYDDLARKAIEVDFDGIRVLIASLDDLIRMKRAAGRPKDLVEVAILLALKDEVESTIQG